MQENADNTAKQQKQKPQTVSVPPAPVQNQSKNHKTDTFKTINDLFDENETETESENPPVVPRPQSNLANESNENDTNISSSNNNNQNKKSDNFLSSSDESSSSSSSSSSSGSSSSDSSSSDEDDDSSSSSSSSSSDAESSSSSCDSMDESKTAVKSKLKPNNLLNNKDLQSKPPLLTAKNPLIINNKPFSNLNFKQHQKPTRPIAAESKIQPKVVTPVSNPPSAKSDTSTINSNPNSNAKASSSGSDKPSNPDMENDGDNEQDDDDDNNENENDEDNTNMTLENIIKNINSPNKKSSSSSSTSSSKNTSPQLPATPDSTINKKEVQNPKSSNSESSSITFTLSDEEISDDSNASNQNMLNLYNNQTTVSFNQNTKLAELEPVSEPTTLNVSSLKKIRTKKSMCLKKNSHFELNYISTQNMRFFKKKAFIRLKMCKSAPKKFYFISVSYLI